MSEIDPIYQELAVRLLSGESKYVPQIIAKLANLDQARILRELPVSSTEELAERLNMDKKTVDELVRDLYEKGCLYYSRSKGGIRFAQDLVELRDAATSHPKFDESLGQEFFDLWDAWTNEESAQHLADGMKTIARTGPGGRVMAQWKSIKDVPGVQAFDDVREVLRANADTLAINPCCCLRITKDPTRDIPEEICIVIRKTAEYSVDRGSGRKITVKEALDILKDIEKHALVHITNNAKFIRRLISNSDTRCLAFRWVKPYNPDATVEAWQLWAPSRFQATVDPEKCLGCKTCVELCLFDAARMKHYPEFGEERAYIDTEKCMGCGNCVLLCPIGAKKMVLVRPPEFIPDRMER